MNAMHVHHKTHLFLASTKTKSKLYARSTFDIYNAMAEDNGAVGWWCVKFQMRLVRGGALKHLVKSHADWCHSFLE